MGNFGVVVFESPQWGQSCVRMWSRESDYCFHQDLGQSQTHLWGRRSDFVVVIKSTLAVLSPFVGTLK